jgi:hypothetical protein
MTETVEWYANAGKTPLSDEGAQWKVRAALRAQEWGVVRDTIQAMPPTLAALPEWTYWLGRALKAGGRTTEADALFEKIAGQANFYGNLADEELGRTVLPPPKAAQPPPKSKKPPATTWAYVARWPSSGWTCAPRQSRNGTGRCAAWMTANCSPPPTSPSVTRSGTAPSTRPTGPRTNTISPCASSPPTASRFARPPRISRSTMPGCMA